MSTVIHEKSKTSYPSATRLFEDITEIFVTPPKNAKMTHVHRRIVTSLAVMKEAPEAEIELVSKVLKELSEQLDNLQDKSIAKEDEQTDAKTDALVNRALTAAEEPAEGSMSTKESESRGELFMAKMREKEMESFLKRIEHKELVPSKELQGLLKVSRQSVSDAVKSGRIFALVGPSGENYYPAFFADPKYDRRSLEKVSKALGGLPASVKFHFFMSKFHSLGNLTPLNALAEGLLTKTLAAAKGYAER